MSEPAPHPLPPRDLAKYDLPIHDESGPWIRIHGTYPDPFFFGTTLKYRFDDPERRFGVLYAGLRLAGAFIEVYGERRRYRSLSIREVQNVHVSELKPRRPAHVVDIRGIGLAHLPGSPDGRLATGDCSISRAWSRAFHEHPARPDGIIYRARHNLDEISVALFDRFRGELDAATSLLFNHADFDGVLGHYDLGLVGTPTLKPPP